MFGGGRVSFSPSLPLRDRILFSTNGPFLQVKCKSSEDVRVMTVRFSRVQNTKVRIYEINDIFATLIT